MKRGVRRRVKAARAGSATDFPHPTNAELAELLGLEAESAEGHLQQAYRRAARAAFLWREEATALVQEERALTTLDSVGPFLARRISAWIASPPAVTTPPPLRQGFLTMSEVSRVLATQPDWRARLKGDLHMHTHWSDGSGTVADLAEAALAHGYSYIAVTDHTKALKIANGLDETRLRAQGNEIDACNANLQQRGAALTVLRSAEINLTPLGESDIDPDLLAELDLVTGSFHSALRREDDQTERYFAGLRNPGVLILGHPRGRVYNYRAGLNADWQRVFAEAARLDKAVEIDAYPDRQDLSLELLEVARCEGCRVALGTDAHHPWQLGFMDLALGAACLANIPPERIVNFMTLPDLRKWAASVRSGKAKDRTRRSRTRVDR